MLKKTIQTGDHTCPWWLAFTFDNPLRTLVHNPQKILGDLVRPGDTVLDIGCGMGYFSVAMAYLVGETGQVIAADLQERMLAGTTRRAKRLGLLPRLRLHRCTPDRIGLEQPVDFALAFWMVHEVRRPEPFLAEIYTLLKPGGRLLIVEPLIHVSAAAFQSTLDLAQRVGLIAEKRLRVRLSQAILLHKPDSPD